jgi:hypothetical protein
MNKSNYHKNSHSINFKNNIKNTEHFEEKLKEIAPDKAKTVSELIKLKSPKKNLVFSNKIIKINKKSESIDFLNVKDDRSKQIFTDSQIENYGRKFDVNHKKLLKIRGESENFLNKYKLIKEIKKRKNISSILEINPQKTFSHLLEKYIDKGYKVPNLSSINNIFKFSPLLINNKCSSRDIDYLIRINEIDKDDNNEECKILNKNEKSIKFMEKLNKIILERQNMNKKIRDKDNLRIISFLKKYPTINIKNENNKTESNTELEIEKINNEIIELREIEKQIEEKKNIKIKKQRIKSFNLNARNKSSFGNVDTTAENFMNLSVKSFHKCGISTKRSTFLKNLNQNSSDGFSKFNSNLNSGRKTCADSENLSNFGYSTSKFENDRTKYKKKFNSEYINYALNSINLVDPKIKENKTDSYFFEIPKREIKSKDIVKNIDKHEFIDDGVNKNYENLANHFKDKLILLNEKARAKDISNSVTVINLKIDECNVSKNFKKTFVNGINFKINTDNIILNDDLDKKIKKLDRIVTKKVDMWNNLQVNKD